MLISSEFLELRGEQHVTTFVDITARKRAELAAERLAATSSYPTRRSSARSEWDGHELNRGWKGFGYSAAEMVGADGATDSC
jgi:hypothetical protein